MKINNKVKATLITFGIVVLFIGGYLGIKFYQLETFTTCLIALLLFMLYVLWDLIYSLLEADLKTKEKQMNHFNRKQE